jgi:signal transduction histidine kinase
MTDSVRDATGATRFDSWRADAAGMAPVLAFALVAVSIVAVVYILIGIERRTLALQSRIADVAEPARAEVHNVQRILALEMSAKRGFLLTGNPVFLDRYQQLVGAEEEAYRTLETYAASLGDEVAERLRTLREFAPRWHAYLSVAELRTGPRLEGSLASMLPVQQRLYEETLAHAGRLDDAIRRHAEGLRGEVRAIERRERRAVGVLGVLALVAAGVIFRIGWQMRRLAARSRHLAEIAEERRRETEALMEEKAGFVRGLAHDLKNPIGAIDGYAQLLEDGIMGPLAPEQERAVARIRSAARDTMAIIEDLLFLSTLTEGRLRVVPQPTDVVQLLHETIDDHRILAERRGLRLCAEFGQVPFVTTDPARLRQVIANLLSNAIKYTPTGKVTVRLFHRSGAAETDGWVGVEVSDTGLGIPTGEQERVFEEFHRIHPAQAQGTGLGLAISRRLTRLLGGDLTLVRSEVGAGSTFAVWLPNHFPVAPEHTCRQEARPAVSTA